MPKPRKARKTAKKTVRKQAKSTQSANYNKQAQWKAFHTLQTQADKAWKKFRTDVRKNAKSDVIIRDQKELLLLLGECNYMAKECMRMSNRGKKKHK